MTNDDIVCDLCEIELSNLSNWSCNPCLFNICLRCYWKK